MDWDRYFMDIAIAVSKNSKCLSRQIGVVLVRNKSIIATGYNGPPRGVHHCEGTICPRKAAGYGSGEGLHLCRAAHAERNAISNAALNGVSTNNCILYMNCVLPCKDCAAMIINSGICMVVVDTPGVYDAIGKEMLDEVGIPYDVINLN